MRFNGLAHYLFYDDENACFRSFFEEGADCPCPTFHDLSEADALVEAMLVRMNKHRRILALIDDLSPSSEDEALAEFDCE